MPSVRRLKTLRDVRSALAFVWREVEAGKMAPEVGRLLVACGSAMASVIKDESLEKLESRVDALESREKHR